MENVLEEIKSIIHDQIGNSRSEINRSTRIFEDLRIDGDDAFELLDAFRKKFNVDMSGFNINEYFGPEGLDSIGFIISIFSKNSVDLKPLTLGDLEEAAKAGKWIETP